MNVYHRLVSLCFFFLILALPDFVNATPARCQSTQLKAAATYCQKVFSCESAYSKKPAKDPQAAKRASCVEKAKSVFTGSWDKALAKEQKSGSQCTLSDSGSVVITEEALNVSALSTSVETGWVPMDANSNTVYSALLTAAGTHCSATLNAHAANAAKANNSKLASALSKAQTKFISAANSAINKGSKKGLSYSGVQPATIESNSVSLVNDIVTLTGGVNSSGGGQTGIKPKQLAVGYTHTCTLLEDETVKCWGDNYYGELGLEHRDEIGNDPNEMGANLKRVNLGAGVKVKALAAGDQYTCALLNDNSVKCWGDNEQGQLGLGDTRNRGIKVGDMGDNLPRVDLGTGRTAKAITAGHAFACALLDNDTIKCWGDNYSGQLGLGDTVNRGDNPNEMGDNLLGFNLGTGKVPQSLTAGYSFACALLADHTVKCWGSGAAGALGTEQFAIFGDEPDEMGDNLPTINLGSQRSVSSLSSGSGHVCALLDDLSLKCWGDNGSGQLGLGYDFQDDDVEYSSMDIGDDPNEMGDYLPRVDLGLNRTLKQVVANRRHTCAILDNDTLKCWGRNEVGQLGLGDINARGNDAGEMGDQLPAIDLGAGRSAKSVSLGMFHSCAILDNDTVKCWGENASMGLLGLEDEFARGDEPGEMGDVLPVVKLGN
jgi:alpha-tubulin suppressor-like RCC1 family protein